MKVVNKLCQILTIALGAAALILFFAPFATITASGVEHTFVGTQLAFGTKVEGLSENLAKSADIWFCFFLTLASVLFSALTFKFKGMRYAAPVVLIVDAVYMLVIAVSNPWFFVDTRPLVNPTILTYTGFVLITALVLFGGFALSLSHLLIDDYIIASQNKDKLTIPQRIVRFVRDYKSEVKKIVWPRLNEVVKNTIIVLIICAIIGAFVWILDFGLGQLVQLIIG